MRRCVAASQRRTLSAARAAHTVPRSQRLIAERHMLLVSATRHEIVELLAPYPIDHMVELGV
jgi:hypothetical protein